jgi:glycosyltransferase involved in cell wall biosynthesis
MNIVLLTSAKGWRGSGVSYAKIASGLIDRGHGVRIVTAVPRLTDRLAGLQLPVTQLPGRNSGAREVWALLRILRQVGAEAILADTPDDVRLSVYATLLHRAHIIYRYNHSYRRSRPHLMERVYLSRLAACFFQSRYIRSEAFTHAPRLRYVVSRRIPNGYDTTAFTRDPAAGRGFRARHGIAPETAIVLTSAKLTGNKGHDVAIEALDRVSRQGLDLVYVVCGNGALEQGLRALAADRPFRTIFTGLLDHQEMVAALSAADLVVHPSLREIFPNAVGEAMSCGCAVVASDAGGTGELLGTDGSAGVLVPPGEPVALAEAVQLLLLDRSLRAELGAAARRRIEEEFPLSRMIDGYESGLARVVGKRV